MLWSEMGWDLARVVGGGETGATRELLDELLRRPCGVSPCNTTDMHWLLCGLLGRGWGGVWKAVVGWMRVARGKNGAEQQGYVFSALDRTRAGMPNHTSMNSAGDLFLSPLCTDCNLDSLHSCQGDVRTQTTSPSCTKKSFADLSRRMAL